MLQRIISLGVMPLLLLGLAPRSQSLVVELPNNDVMASVLRELEPTGQGAEMPLRSSFKDCESIVHYLAQRLPELSLNSRNEMAKRIWSMSRKHGFPPEFILSLMEVESNFRPDAISPRGAVGLMQIKESTAQALAMSRALPWGGRASLKDPEKNLELALLYLAELRIRFKKDPRFYITAYNHGPTRLRQLVKDGEAFPDGYYHRVMQKYRRVRREASL